MVQKTYSINSTRTVNIFTALIVFTVMLFYSDLCPYLSDDWHFLFVWEDFDPTANPQRVRNLQDILVSMQNYYQLSGGRVIPHFLVYCMLFFPKFVFFILNSVLFTALCFLLYQITLFFVNCKKAWLFPLICLLTFQFLPMFGDNVLWISGSVNYLWMAVLFLCCINWLLTRFEKASLPEYIMIILVFMLSGASNEITGGMLIVALMLYWIAHFTHQKKSHILRLLLLAVSEIPGMILVLTAPGNTIRRMTVEKIKSPGISEILHTAVSYLQFLMEEDTLFLEVILFTCILSWMQKEKFHENFKDKFLIFIRENFCFFVGMIGIMVLSVTGFLTKRPTIFGGILLIPAFLSALSQIYEFCQDPETENSRKLVIILKSFLNTIALVIILLAICAENILFGIPAVIIFLLNFLLDRLKEEEFQKLDVSKFRKLFSKHASHAMMAVFLLLSISFGINSVKYLTWTKSAKDYETKVTEYVLKNELVAAMNMTADYKDFGRFSPQECTAAPKSYLVAWIAAYYKIDTQEFVEEYSVHKNRLES
ncbi:MAG: hypothetical protein K2G25_03835 [Oscillospiraceae bacterium]|nr:hypothetical protein [Oscillospiraceae bacterium]